MKKILFIEDESALQETFEDVFKQEGYKIIPALDGEAGLKIAKTEKPDLIILDLILPKVDGFVVLKTLKQDPETQDIPVIILTNLEEIKNVDKALELGATTYLVKTQYSLEDLIRKVKESIQE